MSTEKEDTDPSSPGALRTPSGRHPATDPGLGPRSEAQKLARRPVAVVVPPPSLRRPGDPNAITPPESPISAAALANKDSVELLLEGMAGPRPDRRKAKPQSDGEASAAYHAEHGVRQARLASEPGPKVVVERPRLPSAISTEPPPSKARSRGEPREALSTFVPARALRRRMALALVAGALFVLLLFVGLKVTSERPLSTASAPAATGADIGTVAAHPPTVAPDVAGPAAAPAVSPRASQASTREVTDRNAAAAAKTPGAPVTTGKGRRKAQGGSSASGSGDLGEFSTTF